VNILFASSEVFPFAKTGGLADILGSLPEALSKKGHICSVILPFYKCVREKFSPTLFKEDKNFNLYFLKYNSVNVYFIEKDEYYKRDYLYSTPEGDYPDNALRFGFFAKSICKAISYIGKQDILHCNDWQTALVPLYVKLFHKEDKLFSETKVVFTVHNLSYQGLFEKDVMSGIDLPRELFTPKQLEFYGRLNFMKGGLIYSDIITTVSEGYKREILTQEFGCGLDDLLRTRKKDIYGVVNGVDYSVWNPAEDEFIVKKYTKDDLSGKIECKKDLLKEFGIEYDSKRPVIGMITRLAEQKGIDLVAEKMEDIIKLGIDFVILGFGNQKYNNIFKELSKKYKSNLGIRIAFDNALAHRIEAGCDMFLMPSRYEPCGLNQLYSLKYATIPIVRATGGLDDTIENFNPSTKKGNGFKFKDASCVALLESIKEAVNVFKDKTLWNTLINNALLCDYSWDTSAEKYESLYKKIL